MPEVLRQPNILVLEDEIVMQDTLLDFLDEAGYKVDGAASADAALELAKKQTFDLMISDIRMERSKTLVPTASGSQPLQDGVDTATYIKNSLQPHLYIIIITGYADEDARVRALRAGVDYYLYKKDFTEVAYLIEKVRRVLGQRQEKGFLEQLFAPLWAKPRALLKSYEKANYEKALTALNEGRLAAYRAFLVGVQSGLLIRGSALEIWDRLARLEAVYPTLTEPPKMGELFRQYKQLEQEIPSWNNAKTATNKFRTPEQVGLAQFRNLFENIARGNLMPAQLQMAEHVRQVVPAPPEREKVQLFEALWGPRS